MSKGIILVDMLIALALAALFVGLIGRSEGEVRQLFVYARERERLIDTYEEHAGEFLGMLPYESHEIVLSEDTENEETRLLARASWHGNEKIETLITVSSDRGAVTFSHVHPYPYENISSVVGTSMCSVDFRHSENISVVPLILPIDPLLPLTDLEVRGHIAYVSTDSTKATEPDLLIVDFSDRTDPLLLSSLHTGPGISSLALASHYVYAAAASTAAQLHVIRLDALDDMSVVTKYQLPLPHATATQPLGSAIFYRDDRVYLGTEKWDGSEFNILSVTNPANPQRLSNFETGSRVNDIYVRDQTAYVAASDRHQFRVVDIASSTSPMYVSSLEPSGWERQEGKALSFFEDSLQAGRTSGGFNIKADHELFLWASSSPVMPDVGGGFKSVDISGGVYGVVADRRHVYAATRQIDREVMIFARGGPGDVLATSSPVATISLPVAPQTLTCDDDRLYVLARTAPVIYEITFEP